LSADLTCLGAMAKYRQFILWKTAGKNDKIPISPARGYACSPTDRNEWVSLEEAEAIAPLYGAGIAFVFAAEDPFFFLDIDGALQPDGSWSPLAVSLCRRLAGAAVEVSQSGKGLHVFGSGTLPEHACKNVPLGIELYTQERFVALTGTGVTGDSGFDCTVAATAIVAEYFPRKEHEQGVEWTDGPAEDWSGPEDDAELIERMLRSSSAGAAFGSKASVKQLWEADTDALAALYPSSTGGDFDGSSADQALCNHLAFWTGKDCARMQRLFEQSALVRDKWFDREKYREDTILNAVASCTAVYGSRQAEQVARPPSAVGEVPDAPMQSAASGIREGFQFLSVPQQLELFKGCVYVRDRHRAFTPDGCLLKPEQFRAAYGGYVFALDAINDKITKNAWEAFTESQGYSFPKAHSVCFRPDQPPGAILEREGHLLVNTYVPIRTRRIEGDATRFREVVRKLFPAEQDRQIVLAYMAAVVQYPCVKFQWAPLIQGCEGNGKSLLTRCLTAAIGERYTHLPNAADLSNKFNSWILGKLFIGVEEVYAADRREVLDALKPMITNDRIELQGKGSDQVTGDNRANFFMCTNHKDAILKTRTDRRFAVFYTPHQEDGDIERDGMGGSYFPNLYRWLREEDGYAIVTNYLATYAIPDALNPATSCHRAPETTSTNEAVALSLGGVEQDLMEVVEQGRPGFCNGWISSMAFDRFLEERRDSRRIPPNRRKDILHALGYILHPHLKSGRTSSVVPLDGGKPRLYIRRNHSAATLTRGADIVAAYLEAQAPDARTVAPVSAAESFR